MESWPDWIIVLVFLASTLSGPALVILWADLSTRGKQDPEFVARLNVYEAEKSLRLAHLKVCEAETALAEHGHEQAAEARARAERSLRRLQHSRARYEEWHT